MARKKNMDDGVKAPPRELKKLIRFIKPYRKWFGLSVLLILLSSLTTMLFPILMGKLFAGTETSNGSGFWQIGDLSFTKSVVVWLFITFGVQALLSFLRILSSARVTEGVLRDLRQNAFAKLISAPMEFHHRNKVGDLTSRIATDINLLEETYNTTIAEFTRQTVMVIVGIGALLLLSWKLTLVMLAIIPVVAIVAVIFGRYIKSLGKLAQDAAAQSNTVLEEALTGIIAVKAFTNESFERVRYGRATSDIRAINLKNATWRAAFVSFIIFCLFGSIVVVIWQGVEMVSKGEMPQDAFYAFILYTLFIGASIGSLPEMYARIQRAAGATSRLLEIIDEKPEFDTSKEFSTELNGSVSFKQVSFAYASRKDLPVLHDVSFEASAGEQIAIVGASGAGKSTIAALLLQLYHPVGGQILFDNKPAEEYEMQALRKNMAFVPQEVILFGGTIRENIGYGKPDATEEEVKRAAEQANAMEFISKFPEGMETLVGDRGVQLSGGQRQRIAIARAILRNPRILILDEATSSLDSESEKLVQDALKTLMQGRTSFVIAHRLSTIRNANQILVLQQGKIVERGTHEALLNAGEGVYKNLVQIQQAG